MEGLDFMKIGNMGKDYNLQVSRKPSSEKSETSKDLVTLGQGNEKPDILYMPLDNVKSHDGGAMLAILAFIAGAGGVVGALSSGAGLLGRTLGGVPGAIIATGVTTAAGAAVGSLNPFGSTKKEVIKGALAAGGLAALGGAMGGIANPWISIPITLTAGAAGGVAATIFGN